MNFEAFSTPTSFVHRLDARVKLLAGLALVLVIALCRSFPTACAGLLIGALLVLAAQLDLKLVLWRLLLVNGFVLFLWFTLPLTYPGEEAFSIGPLRFSADGIMLAGLISIKTNATVLVLISLIATSSLAALGQALAKLKVPAKLCLLLLFSYRYIFVIHQEYLRLLRAAPVERRKRSHRDRPGVPGQAGRCSLMASKSKRFRAIRAELAAMGLEVIDKRQRTHLVLRLRNRHGLEISMPFAVSPSETQCSDKNKTTQLRRFAAAKNWDDYTR